MAVLTQEPFDVIRADCQDCGWVVGQAVTRTASWSPKVVREIGRHWNEEPTHQILLRRNNEED